MNTKAVLLGSLLGSQKRTLPLQPEKNPALAARREPCPRVSAFYEHVLMALRRCVRCFNLCIKLLIKSGLLASPLRVFNPSDLGPFDIISKHICGL